MKNFTRIATIAVTTVGLAAGGLALADRSGGERGERMLERVSDRLELDDNQRAALDTLFVEVTDMRELMKGDGNDVRADIAALLSADAFDQGAALEMITSRTEAIQTGAPELVAAAAVFLDGLTAEQKADIADFAEQGRGRRGH